jgi:hypothetical protein
MPSFISSSRSPAYFYIKLLLSICSVLILGFELSGDYLLKHHSETYARVSRQYAEAVTARLARPGAAVPVLMVGNSLLLEGVDTKLLQDLIAPQIRVYPIFLEATGYYDWFYGLQRLFRQGSRPQVVVLGVGVNSFLADSVRQDYAPMTLLDLRDLLDVASDLKMDHTATSNLLLAHSSVFWDTRGVIRTQLLRQTVPHYGELVMLLKPQPSIPPPARFHAIACSRLQSLRRLCEEHGARLILLIPPTLASEDAVREMTIACAKAGVESLVPIAPTALSAKYYQPDELHLNSEGAALFTSALAGSLPASVSHYAASPRN